MPVCASCGHENSEKARFCEACGAALETGRVPREQRKTVTVLFCDVTGSTALGESTDPEALRAVLARYFERMKGILESHGGTVEKFIGDAVMAVFGVPQVHEDDALRACRAAVEMRDALPELGLQARIGLNTGEVVTGTEERLATGDAVNVAARLEQAARPGEILLGQDTLALARDGVEADAVSPVELKGKSEAVPAFRLLAVTGELSRRHDVRMVGRERELTRLRSAYEQAVHDRSCQLFTVLGTAGVGKSRLAYEFLDGLDARVLRGRCLSYGEGITYWPVVEVLRHLSALPAGPAAAPLRSLLGETEEGTTAEEIAWAFRKLLEEQAAEQPLVCVFDDIHWGEETFLDLIEHVADLSREAPLLLLCMARPELLDRRSSWGGGKLNSTTVLLEPLSADETDALLEVLGGAEPELRARVRDAAEGNPLFVEEMLALVREAGDGQIIVPPTIQALLVARLDQLDSSERSVLESGAVEGRVFHRGAVQALAPNEPQLPQRLVSLVRKELVRPDKTLIPGDEAFRFRHLLIRDAAYDALPKATRAELHECFAAWLEERRADIVELDEILGHHLDQAARYKTELGQSDPALAGRAAERLSAAGRRALWRGDRRAATPLLQRALELTRPGRLDVQLELDFAEAQFSPRAAADIADAAAARARRRGDWAAEAVAHVVAVDYRVEFSADPPIDEWETAAQEALPLLEEAQDHAALARVWFVLGQAANMRGRFEEWGLAREQQLRHSRLAGRPDPWVGLGGPLLIGPRPADEALRTLDDVYSDVSHPLLVLSRGELLAMLGHSNEIWSAAQEASKQLGQLGQLDGSDHLAEIARFAGDYEAAAHYLRLHCEGLEARGDRGHLSTYAPTRGRFLCMLGRHDEAEPLAQVGRELGDKNDASTQMVWRQAQALVHANRGEHADAENLSHEAVEVAEGTDALNYQGDAYTDLAEVFVAAGRTDEAAQALEQALDRYGRKKNLAMVAQVKPKLEELRARVS